MDLNLRQAIKSNIAGQNDKELEAVIVDAIQRGEEKMLPGLGVLFEMIWENSTDEEKNMMLKTLEEEVQKL